MTSFSTGSNKLDDAIYSKVKEAVSSIKTIDDFKKAFSELKAKHAGDNKGGFTEAEKAYGSAIKTILDGMSEKMKNSGT